MLLSRSLPALQDQAKEAQNKTPSCYTYSSENGVERIEIMQNTLTEWIVGYMSWGNE